jgi:hypothetical protein
MRVAALFLSLVVLSVSAVRASALRTFPVTLHMLTSGSRETFEGHFGRANTLFARGGVAFEIDAVAPLDGSHASLVTREDRDALGRDAHARTIDVFVVSSLMDVDEPGRARRGVHWRDRTRRGVRYVIIVESAGPWVLAHELGHYFGNAHSPVAGNLMSYDWSRGDPVFDDAQIRKIDRSAASLFRSFGLARAQRVTGSPR